MNFVARTGYVSSPPVRIYVGKKKGVRFRMTVYQGKGKPVALYMIVAWKPYLRSAMLKLNVGDSIMIMGWEEYARYIDFSGKEVAETHTIPFSFERLAGDRDTGKDKCHYLKDPSTARAKDILSGEGPDASAGEGGAMSSEVAAMMNTPMMRAVMQDAAAAFDDEDDDDDDESVDWGDSPAQTEEPIDWLSVRQIQGDIPEPPVDNNGEVRYTLSGISPKKAQNERPASNNKTNSRGMTVMLTRRKKKTTIHK